MIAVWYLVATLHSSGAVVIPQVDHAQCVKNREWIMHTQNGFSRPYCIEGAAGIPLMANSGKAGDE